MRRIVIGFALLGGIVAASGCQYMYATPAVQGVRTSSVTRSSRPTSGIVTPRSGEPVCYQTNRVVLPAGTNK